MFQINIHSKLYLYPKIVYKYLKCYIRTKTLIKNKSKRTKMNLFINYSNLYAQRKWKKKTGDVLMNK